VDALGSLATEKKRKAVGWGKFAGVMAIVTGGLSCIGIITIPMALFQIFAGINMWNASKKMREFMDSNLESQKDEYVNLMMEYTRNMGIYFVLYLIVVVVGILLYGLIAVVALAVFTRAYGGF